MTIQYDGFQEVFEIRFAKLPDEAYADATDVVQRSVSSSQRTSTGASNRMSMAVHAETDSEEDEEESEAEDPRTGDLHKLQMQLKQVQHPSLHFGLHAVGRHSV